MLIKNLKIIFIIIFTITISSALININNANNIKDDYINKDLIITHTKNEEIIWKKELLFFYNYFNLTNNNDVLTKIIQLQTEANLNSNWYFTNEMLKYIYLNYYIKSNNLPYYIKKRLEIYSTMSEYENKWKKPPETFDRKIYFWLSENITWTHLDEKLYNELVKTFKIQKKLKKPKNKIIVKKIKGVFILIGYLKGELDILTYASPWKIKYKTKTWVFDLETVYTKKTRISDIYYVILPYYIKINNWAIYIHAWLTTWKRESHWCIRIPLFYAEYLLSTFNKEDNFEFMILDT